ncbi:hypothetical protein SAMN05421741_101114 [Paenimyroides ummariense]|uniref:Uncharacterized protein n=1 Tax=Paenimyroides ummariense TaxID=913024 RepID=A0A1I4W929_9FLAO|nr:hypothetical protein [Paenimyroides ummariense]SFN09800.1 hypothetical protein SAMN05421741_101114 [Paenimyroides ummariense]
MSHNGQDKSGNALKYSLIPLMLGVVLIFFIHRSCDTALFEPTPQKGTKTIVVEDELSPEQPLVKQDTTSTAAATTATEPAAETVAQDTVQAAK